MKDDIGSNITLKLCTFKYVYILYFLKDILCILSKLSHSFWSKFVDIIIGSMVKTDFAQIHMFFIEEITDLNSETFNKQSKYHILSEFGP